MINTNPIEDNNMTPSTAAASASAAASAADGEERAMQVADLDALLLNPPKAQ